jgi:hypothetical protein
MFCCFAVGFSVNVLYIPIWENYALVGWGFGGFAFGYVFAD